MPEARQDRDSPLEDPATKQKSQIPALQWHIDLQGPVARVGSAPPTAGAGSAGSLPVRFQQPHGDSTANSGAQLPAKKPPVQHQAEDRPATALAALDAGKRRFLEAPGLQRSASADIAWRVLQPPKTAHTAQEPAKPGRMAPDTSKKAGSPPSRPAMQRGSQPGRAGVQAAANKPSSPALQQRAQPPDDGGQGSDPAALRRAKLLALKSRTAQKVPDALRPQEPPRRASGSQAPTPQRRVSAQQPSQGAPPPSLQRKTSAAGQPAPRRSSSASGAATPKARVSYDLSNLQDSGSADSGGMVRCQGCGRTFAPGPFEKHERICAKVFQNKRKPLDMKEQRTSADIAAAGTFGEPPPLPPRGKKGARSAAPSAPEPPARKAVPKWKAQSGQLRAAMAAARGDLPFDAPPVVDDSLVPCPHCGRRFNAKAAERHIPLCQDIRAKPTRLIAKGRQGKR